MADVKTHQDGYVEKEATFWFCTDFCCSLSCEKEKDFLVQDLVAFFDNCR